MRLNKIKLSGFKSFVDPTTVPLPGNLTGVVGPNGCGKSNIIDAVRWVMGELSARHLRGDSMADVIFNGSTARKPVGAASVELVFDNSDGKIGGAYASFSEISLKRTVSRDGSSAYFINGGRCRRKDITQLFLGTGLGSRSYAIIEQGMISRVIEARHDDMRAFIEEAAGVSLYKERRRETEARIADARENLARVSDLRDEVDKQIRHLQRQANIARRYQDLKGQERTLLAELLALRLRDLDGGAERQDALVRERELSMQAALADQRAAEAAIEKQREFHSERTDVVARTQGRFYELGSDVTRAEEAVRHARENRERAQVELTQVQAAIQALEGQLAHDREEHGRLAEHIEQLEPLVASHREREQAAAAALTLAESAQAEWQQRWEHFNRECGSAAQSAQVEAVRIEQLESHGHRLRAQADRLDLELEHLLAQRGEDALEALTQRAVDARGGAEQLSANVQAALSRVHALRQEQTTLEQRLERARRDREHARSELLALEALQRAALREKAADAERWLASLTSGVGKQRLAETLEVQGGWERAVETVLGDYLEAVSTQNLESLPGLLGTLSAGSVTFFEAQGAAGAAPSADSLAAQVRGPQAVRMLLAGVRVADTLAGALARRAELAPGESIITPSGEWVGPGWLRVSRGGDTHSGVLEREHRLKGLREHSAAAEGQATELEAALAGLRQQVQQAERERDEVQVRAHSAHREHAELHGQLEGLKARLEESAQRHERIVRDRGEVERDIQLTQEGLLRARAEHQSASERLALLDGQRDALESEREQRREHAGAARTHAQAIQLELRDAMVQLESRRSSHVATAAAIDRLHTQRGAHDERREALEAVLAQGDAPILEMQQRLQDALARRLEVEAELASARRDQEDSESELRTLEQRRQGAAERVEAERAAMEEARLAFQESRVRREALMEQFAATQCDLAAVSAQLAEQADVIEWEQRLSAVRADVERLGQVNLAAIDELAECTQRKNYLDSQYADVNEALETLEQAMRKMDRETRSRFDETFNRVNAGLQEKFPRLFGGGHAYLELVGDDPLAAGVAVMARPPGKRNSTISQLSGGEKALTAVALVFSIFDLNPAPFCLLDEVDAPLDEHNVGRFCDIVRDMSGRVQFIFITHNKVTMELASQLVGVTMNEPGVSRLVAVDIDEAVRLAAV